MKFSNKAIKNSLYDLRDPYKSVNYLQQPNSNGQSNTSRPQRSLPLSYWPWVPLQLPEKISEVHINLVNRLQKSG